MERQELKERIKKTGWTIKAFAAALDCTPQHLGAVLNGRAPLTQSLKEKIEKTINEIHFTMPVWITVYFKSAEWETILETLPKDIDIQATLKDYILWLSMHFYIENMPAGAKETFIKQEKAAGFDTRKTPLFVHLKPKKGEKAKSICVFPQDDNQE